MSRAYLAVKADCRCSGRYSAAPDNGDAAAGDVTPSDESGISARRAESQSIAIYRLWGDGAFCAYQWAPARRSLLSFLRCFETLTGKSILGQVASCLGLEKGGQLVDRKSAVSIGRG